MLNGTTVLKSLQDLSFLAASAAPAKTPKTAAKKTKPSPVKAAKKAKTPEPTIVEIAPVEVAPEAPPVAEVQTPAPGIVIWKGLVKIFKPKYGDRIEDGIIELWLQMPGDPESNIRLRISDRNTLDPSKSGALKGKLEIVMERVGEREVIRLNFVLSGKSNKTKPKLEFVFGPMVGNLLHSGCVWRWRVAFHWFAGIRKIAEQTAEPVVMPLAA